MQGEMASSQVSISVVVPAYNASGYIRRVITPLLDMLKAGEVDEVLIVDDCSTDDTPKIAKEMGATVLYLDLMTINPMVSSFCPNIRI